MGNIVYCSQHAKERLKERCGVNKKSTLRCAELAVSRGQHYTETKGSVRKWLEAQIIDEEKQIYVHGDKAYVFTNSMILVTELQLPPEIVRCNNNNRRKASRASDRHRPMPA